MRSCFSSLFFTRASRGGPLHKAVRLFLGRAHSPEVYTSILSIKLAKTWRPLRYQRPQCLNIPPRRPTILHSL